MTVFRPFFIQVALPYSVIRGESIAITIVVFNYQNKGTQAEVALENKKGEFEFTIASDEMNTIEGSRQDVKRKFVSIPAQDGSSVSFLITPKRLGPIEIKVTATTNTAGDSVVKKLLVKPEGQAQYFNQAVLVDGRESTSNGVKKDVLISIPNNAVQGSERVTISVIGDILGPGMNNIDDLLQMPYGCGEQNMLNFVPNIVILDYLSRADRLTPQIKNKALKHIESGYQRELTYKRPDGSFSAFGNSDKSGSTWLSAFVLKSFIQARPYLDLDPNVVEATTQWLMSRQLSDGSFDEPGEVHHKAMQGGAGGKGSPALSAFVLIAILQDKNVARRNYSSQITKTEQYLVRKLRSSSSPYEVSIITYALHLADSPAADSAYQTMQNMARRSPDQTWWTSERKDGKKEDLSDKQSFHFFLPKSNDVEATSYALLTHVLRAEIEPAVPILRWLVNQQNEKGGYSSTQDTVIGLQALAELASRISSSPVSITANFRYGSDKNSPDIRSRSMRIEPENAMTLQRFDLPSNTRFVEFTSTGFGSAIIQVSWQYNLAVSAEEPAFFLNPQIGKTSNENFLQLNICT